MALELRFILEGAVALGVLVTVLLHHRRALARVLREAEDYSRAIPPPQVTVHPPQVVVSLPQVMVQVVPRNDPALPAPVPPAPSPVMSRECVAEVVESMRQKFDIALCSYDPGQKLVSTMQAIQRAADEAGAAVPDDAKDTARTLLFPVPVPAPVPVPVGSSNG